MVNENPGIGVSHKNLVYWVKIIVRNEYFSMHKGNIVLRIDQEYNMDIDKTSVKCTETHIIVGLLKIG